MGYVGTKSVAPILLDGLRALEYRGYDSAGMHIVGKAPTKAVGGVNNLAKKIDNSIVGYAGIAHTRWATHGVPTEINAHPHFDMSGTIALCHNGIIENYRELKADLIDQGYSFTSDTDSEVLAKLIGSYYQDDLLAAVQKALALVRGTYGILVTSDHHPDRIITARMGSPVVLGISPMGTFIASDTAPLLAHTKKVVYLEDGECAVVTKNGYDVLSLGGRKKHKKMETVDWDIESVQKKGYEHFMLKEIHEIPEVIKNTIRGRLLPAAGNVKLGGVEAVFARLTSIDRLTIVGCGSAYYAGQVGKYILEEYAQLPVDVELGSEYRYKKNLPSGNGAVIAITQSGETADTLASIRTAKELNQLTLGIVNAVGSTIARETQAGVYNHAGPEIAVASTKAFISQITVLVLLTIMIGREKGLSKAEGAKIVAELERLPDILQTYLADTSAIQAVAKKYAQYTNMMFLGRKFHMPIAYEGALKMKEVSYVHAEAYAGGELKHGPIAMLDANFPVIALAPKNDVYEKMVSNIEEVKARKAPVLAITTERNTDMNNIADDVLFVPCVHPILQPIVSTVPLQLLAYYIGIEKGLNVDRPRNLAKSVTVE